MIGAVTGILLYFIIIIFRKRFEEIPFNYNIRVIVNALFPNIILRLKLLVRYNNISVFYERILI